MIPTYQYLSIYLPNDFRPFRSENSQIFTIISQMEYRPTVRYCSNKASHRVTKHHKREDSPLPPPQRKNTGSGRALTEDGDASRVAGGADVIGGSAADGGVVEGPSYSPQGELGPTAAHLGLLVDEPLVRHLRRHGPCQSATAIWEMNGTPMRIAW